MTPGKLSEPELTRVLVALGLRLTDTNREQLSTMLDALVLFDERNDRYQDLWKEYGAIDCAHHIKSKAARVMREIQSSPHREEVDLDDAYDGINYNCFFIRNVLDGNLGVIEE